MSSKKQIFHPPETSQGSLLALAPVWGPDTHTAFIDQIINKAESIAACVSVKADRVSERVLKVSCFLFFNPASKVNIPSGLQSSDCGESESKAREIGMNFFLPPEKLRFHRFGFPSSEIPHASTVIHLGRHHQLQLINQMMVWWAENGRGDSSLWAPFGLHAHKTKKNKQKQNNETKKRSYFFCNWANAHKGHVTSIVAESFHLTANKGNKPQSLSLARLAYEIRGTEKK